MATYLITLNVLNPATGAVVGVRFAVDPAALTQQRWANGYQKVRDAIDQLAASSSGQEPQEL